MQFFLLTVSYRSCPVESGADVKLVDSGNGPFGTFEANVFKFAESSEGRVS